MLYWIYVMKHGMLTRESTSQDKIDKWFDAKTKGSDRLCQDAVKAEVGEQCRRF